MLVLFSFVGADAQLALGSAPTALDGPCLEAGVGSRMVIMVSGLTSFGKMDVNGAGELVHLLNPASHSVIGSKHQIG